MDVMKKVVYPGTFDPVTLGHIDLIKRASILFDEVIVTIAINPSKLSPLFSIEERLELLNKSVEGIEKVRVDWFEGLTVDYARKEGAIGIIRGLRAISDFEYEFQMALMNRNMAGDVDTIFLMPHEKFTYLNSTLIKGLAQFQADVSEFVPAAVNEALMKKFAR
jgi:pantetheine-phosphate adenylyltransferase